MVLGKGQIQFYFFLIERIVIEWSVVVVLNFVWEYIDCDVIDLSLEFIGTRKSGTCVLRKVA